MILKCDAIVLAYIREHPQDQAVKAFMNAFEDCQFNTTETSFTIFSLLAQRLCQLSGGEIECQLLRAEDGTIQQMSYPQEGNA